MFKGIFSAVKNAVSTTKAVITRKDSDLMEILNSQYKLKDRVRLAYGLVLNEKGDIKRLEQSLKYLEKLTDSIPLDSEYIGLRKDLITLESLVRTRINFDSGKVRNVFGNLLSYVNYYKTPRFSDFIEDRLKDGMRLDADFGSPYATEEGTFHYSSLMKYRILN